jgi:hypothetical protein
MANIFFKKSSQGGSVKFDKRSMRTPMSLKEATIKRMRTEISHLEEVAPTLLVGQAEQNKMIDLFSSSPKFNTINTMLATIVYGVIVTTPRAVDVGGEITSLQGKIFEVFGAKKEKKLKLKEDAMIYYFFITNLLSIYNGPTVMEGDLELGSGSESDYTDDSEDYSDEDSDPN